jgi:hypothetical protein
MLQNDTKAFVKDARNSHDFLFKTSTAVSRNTILEFQTT